jgi:hypothetical protein
MSVVIHEVVTIRDKHMNRSEIFKDDGTYLKAVTSPIITGYVDAAAYNHLREVLTELATASITAVDLATNCKPLKSNLSIALSGHSVDSATSEFMDDVATAGVTIGSVTLV